MVARILAASLVVLLLAAPAIAQVSPGDLQEAEARLDALRADMADLTARYEAAITRDEELGSTIESLERQVANRELEATRLQGQIQDRARDIYVGAAEGGLASVFGATKPNELDTRNQYLRDVGSSDRALLNDLVVLNAELAAQTSELEDTRADQQDAIAELETIAGELNGRLEAAQSEYQALYAQYLEEEAKRQAEAEARRIAEEAARQRAADEARQATSTTGSGSDDGTGTTAAETTPTTAAPVADAPSTGGGMSCPISGFTSFSDTWGAPRSGGRFHQGVDMLAARGTPVAAVDSGVVLRMRNGGLGGITVWLETDNGDEYYYAHLDGWASGLSAGQRVSSGQQLGYVGTTGNAPANIPHLHWEYHPGGGGAVNPTPLAYRLCG